MINIQTFSKSKSKEQGSISNVSTNAKSSNEVEGVYLWGKYHDHTQNIDGDLQNVGNINAEGNIITSGNVGCNVIDADTVNSVNVFSDLVDASNYYGVDADITNINSNSITSLSADITTLNSEDITAHNLNITGQAHFFELVIDKIKSAGGSVILTPVDGFRTDKVEEAGTFEVDNMTYNTTDQIFIRNHPLYFRFPNAPKGKNIVAEFTTSCHNLKYFYSWGLNQRTAILYSNGELRAGTNGNANDMFVSPFINVENITTIRFDSDGIPQQSGQNAKIAAYDEDLNYIQANSVGNQQTFTWTKGANTKWIRFTGRNTFTNGKVLFNNQTEGDITIKYIWEDYRKNGSTSSTYNAPMIFLNDCKGFKLYRDNNNTIFKNADEMVLNAVPVIDENGNGQLYDKISQTFATVTGTENNYTGGERVEGGYSDITGYNLYFQSNDGSRAIKNMWQVNDQALCQSFNQAEVGQTQTVSNKYYWCLVDNVGTKEIDNIEYHFIKISNSVYDGVINPSIGDEIAMLGYRGTDDLQRQSAIYIAAYNSIDTGINAPCIVQYKGINDFNLGSHRKNVISDGYTAFHGEFYTTAGDDIEDLIDDVSQGAVSYVHQAFANSADGQLNFSKTYFAGAKYMGFCSNHTASDAALVYTDYIWILAKGDDGQDGVNGTSYYMVSSNSSIQVKDDASTTPPITVRGYKLEGSSRIEKQNTCLITYNGLDYDENSILPITFTPSSMYREIEAGLQSINIQMYDDNAVNVVSSFEIPVIRDGEDGNDGEDGKDAYNYKMIPINEDLSVNTSGTLTVSLQYNIIQIVGTSYNTAIATDNLFIRFKDNVHIEYIELSKNTTTPTYSNSRYQSNWKTQTFGQINYITVELVQMNGQRETILDKRVVYTTLKPMVTFSITDSINATVQGHTTQLGEHSNQIANLRIDVNGIETTVEGVSTDLETVTNNLTQVTQSVNSISSVVRSQQTQINGLKNDTSNLFGNSSYAGADMEDNNKWEVESTAIYSYPLWQNYRCVFDKGVSHEQFYLFSEGEGRIYTPYLYLYSHNIYTLNCDFNYIDADNAIMLIRYGNVSNAQKLNYDAQYYIDAEQEVGENVVEYKPNNIVLSKETDVLKFEVPANGYYRLAFCNIVDVYDEADIDTFTLGYVRLYNGEVEADEFAEWSTVNAESYSEIYQNSGEIKLSVNDINLRIDNEGIELNGDTTVNGTLTLNNTKEGFILHNENGSTQITPESIGTYEEFRQRNKVVNTKKFTNTQILGVTSNNSTYVYANTFVVDMGAIKANSQLTFDNSSITAYFNNTTLTPVSSHIDRRIYENGTVKQVTPNYLTNYTTTTDSSVIIEFQVLLYFNKSQFIGISPKVKVDFNIDITTPAIALMVIGYDGIGINYGNTKTVYFGQNQSTIKYGNQLLNITENNINVNNAKINQNDSTISLTTYNQLPITSNVRLLGFSNNNSYTANIDDSIIIVNNSSRSGAHYIYLPLPSTCNGKVFYIKNIVGGKTVNVKVTGTSEDLIIEADGNKGTATDNISIGNRSYMFISIYDYYIVYYCG